MTYQINPSGPSRQLLDARNVAGLALQESFRREAGKVDPPRDFRWIKAEFTWPSFDHLTFGYGNQVFSVVVELLDGGQSLLTEQERRRCTEAASAFGLVPCSFAVDVRTMRPASGGWNLAHLVTGRPVIPVEQVTAAPIEMSEWELQNFAIQVVRGYIEKDLGGKVDSFCDVVGIDPQIWFKDSRGAKCWVIVRHLRKVVGDEKNQWIGHEKKSVSLRMCDGFFAAVCIASASPVLKDAAGNVVPLSERYSGRAPLWRCDPFHVKFEGLQRIHVA